MYQPWIDRSQAQLRTAIIVLIATIVVLTLLAIGILIGGLATSTPPPTTHVEHQPLNHVSP
jgi:hypothetical protein